MMRSYILRGLSWLSDRRLALFTPRRQRIFLVVAAVAFLGGGWFVFRQLDVEIADLRVSMLLIAVGVGVPLTILSNVLEYQVSGQLLGHAIKFGAALRISLVATAANVLPIPGGLFVRVQGLREEGSSYRYAASATAAVGLAWLGIALFLAGLWLIPVVAVGRATPFLLSGAVTLVASWLLLVARIDSTIKRLLMFGRILAVEVLSVVATTVRLFFLIATLGSVSSVARALVLGVAYVLSAAVGVFPAGLGLREGLAAALSPIVEMTPIMGFAVVSLDRLAAMMLLAPLAFWLALRGRVRTGCENEGLEPDLDSGLSGREAPPDERTTGEGR